MSKRKADIITVAGPSSEGDYPGLVNATLPEGLPKST